MAKQVFQEETCVDERTGQVAAVYLRVHQGAVACTKELEEGIVFAD
jgi:hypothetical protein